MIRKTIFLALAAMLTCLAAGAQAQRQRFFNLTADEVKIDSLLPFFSCSVPLDGAWADSVYTATIEYPEFIEMGDADIRRYLKISGKPLPGLPEVKTNVVVERRRGHLEVSFAPLAMRDGKYVKLVSFMIDVKSRPAARAKSRTRADEGTSPADRYAAHSVLATGRWAKIRVPATGIYEITDALIRRAGFSDMSRVKVYGYGGALLDEVLSGEDLAAHDDLKEVATCTVDGRRLFHAQGPVSWSSATAAKRTRNPYSDYGYYFLTESDGEPLTVDSTAFVDSFYPSADDYHTLHEVDNFAWFQGGRNLFEDDPISAGTSRSYVLTPVSTQPGDASISIGITAGQACSGRIDINGTAAGTFTLNGFSEYDHGKETEMTFKISNTGEADTVTITTTAGGPARLDYISACYSEPRPRPTLKGTAFDAPEYVYNITNQNHHADPQADMVIIVPASAKLTPQAQRLKEFHEQHDGMRVNIVPADELYNEFSSGTPDASAYRRYMKMLYDRAESEADMPSYLVLFGDCVWDSRMNTPECSGLNADDLLLCHESENSFSDVYCYIDDGYFCYLDDGEGGNPRETDKADVAVGRFPVRNVAEAEIMVDKTIRYAENENAGSWQNRFVFMGDDGNDNQHMSDADDMATLTENLNPAFQVERIMWDAYTRESSSTGNSYPEVTRLIKQRQEAGALIMNYSGHGGPNQLSHERVITINDFAQFANENLPLWITASCNIMPFDSQESNIGETAVLNEKGGAVAFFGTTRTVYVTRNNAINQAYLRALLTPENGGYISIGEAQRRAKNELVTSGADRSENKLQYSLLGDPAMTLCLPKLTVVVDSINGTDVTDGKTVSVGAGNIMRVSGYVKDAPTFGGVLSATVRDSRELVTCRWNNRNEDEASAQPFTYYDRTKVLFSGNDSISGGRFEFSFAVPKDINYTDGTGLINLYAVSNDRTLIGNGSCEAFTVGGGDIAENDSVGPSIFCYLNSPSFVNGGKVNSTPYFVAEIMDKDGINTSGNGIGHDLQLVIDGEMARTYNLNDNFSYDFGTYTRGSTYYNIPELEEGEHTLEFRAWDVFNNMSSTSLRFNVVKGLSPQLLSVSCTDNPATTSTTFIISHDRAGSNLDVAIDVMDMSGRLLWTHEESGVSTGSAYTVDWDLTVDGGSRLGTGVYLYRVRMSSDGSPQTSKAKKLVIIGNK